MMTYVEEAKKKQKKKKEEKQANITDWVVGKKRRGYDFHSNLQLYNINTRVIRHKLYFRPNV